MPQPTFRTGETCWVYPHGKPAQAIQATIDIISTNQRSIALRLHGVPLWAVMKGESGLLINQEHAQIEMLLARYAVGPWIEVIGSGHYETEKERPNETTSTTSTNTR
jgi:hypothetical protein